MKSSPPSVISPCFHCFISARANGCVLWLGAAHWRAGFLGVVPARRDPFYRGLPEGERPGLSNATTLRRRVERPRLYEDPFFARNETAKERYRVDIPRARARDHQHDKTFVTIAPTPRRRPAAGPVLLHRDPIIAAYKPQRILDHWVRRSAPRPPLFHHADYSRKGGSGSVLVERNSSTIPR